jgi:hypothetical protein
MDQVVLRVLTVLQELQDQVEQVVHLEQVHRELQQQQ